MRDELSRNLVIGGVTVESAVKQVEDELVNWKCDKYLHQTRAVEVIDGTVLQLETKFSLPTQECPVPTAVVCVYFHLDTSTGNLTFRFEREEVQHELEGQGLTAEMHQRWLDRIIANKLQVRQMHHLVTSFEQTRLEASPGRIEYYMQEDSSGVASEAPDSPVSLLGESTQDLTLQSKVDVGALLTNIFDAADEEGEFELTHREVADLLYATPLDLADWDIKLLMTTATELETGKIQYKPFLQAAPDTIDALHKRRASYNERLKAQSQNMSLVSEETILLCYGDEIDDVGRAVEDSCRNVDSSGCGILTRHEFRNCLTLHTERLSLQEISMLMQMCEEDDMGNVPYDAFPLLLQQLRLDSLMNSLVETDVAMLRAHLILLACRMGLQSDNIMSIWDLRDVLQGANQLCLSRMQIHVILSIVVPDREYNVDICYFLQVCCTIIPWMFDINVVVQTSAMIAKEKADAQAQAELEELQKLQAAAIKQKRGADEEVEEDAQAKIPDSDSVEKSLMLFCSQADGKVGRKQQTLAVKGFVEVMSSEAVQQACQLSESEIRGIVAEAETDERGEVAYAEHIKLWVPIIFELRKSKIYEGVLAKEWGPEEEHLVDLSKYEPQFPIKQSRRDEDSVVSASEAGSRASFANSEGSCIGNIE